MGKRMGASENEYVKKLNNTVSVTNNFDDQNRKGVG